MTITSLPSAPLVTDPPSTFNTKAFAMVGGLPTLVTELNAAIALNDSTAAADIHALALKATPVDADELPLLDSAATFALKRLTWANLKATAKAYFDTLYPAGSGTSTGTNTGDQTSVTGNAGTVTNGVYTTNKDASGGVPGLTLFKLNLKNAANTFTNFLTNATTAARTWTMPDYDGTIATLAGAETLSNKALNGTLGATTPAAATVTTLTATGAATITTTGVVAPMLDIVSTSTTGLSSIGLRTNGNDWEFGARGSAAGEANKFYIYDSTAAAFRFLINSTGAVTIPGTLAVSTAGSTIAVEAVITPTLLNSYVNTGGSYTTTGYWKDAYGVVHLRGHLSSGTVGSPIFTLPDGYRPPALTYFAANYNLDSFACVAIDSSGNVLQTSGTSTSLALNGITFRV